MNMPWSAVFRPGQRVDMSMVFNRMTSRSKCPACNEMNEDHDGQIECHGCGLSYRLFVEPLSTKAPMKGFILDAPGTTEDADSSTMETAKQGADSKFATQVDHYDTFEGFRRVLINCVFVFDDDIQFPPPVNVYVTFLDIWLRLSSLPKRHAGRGPWWGPLFRKTWALLANWRRESMHPENTSLSWYRETVHPSPSNTMLYLYFKEIDANLIKRYGKDYLDTARKHFAICAW